MTEVEILGCDGKPIDVPLNAYCTQCGKNFQDLLWLFATARHGKCASCGGKVIDA